MFLPKKALLASFALFASQCSLKLSFIDHATNFFGPEVSVTQANLSNKSIFCLLCNLSHSWDLGPTGSDLRPFYTGLSACA